jgi:uncharacterized membrane protein YphA (DoxX/SURF4 family)
MRARLSLLTRLERSGVPLLLARLITGGMFLYLGYNKFMEPIDFLKILKEYHILPITPGYYLNTTAIVLPYLEMLCGLALLLGVSIRGAAIVLGGMLLFFYPALISQALKIQEAQGGIPFCDVAFDCGCGTGVEFICSKLVENTILLVGSVIAVFSRSRLYCLSSLLTGGRFLPPVVPDACPRCGCDLTGIPEPQNQDRSPESDADQVSLAPQRQSIT